LHTYTSNLSASPIFVLLKCRCNTIQHTATHCNTLQQHTTTHSDILHHAVTLCHTVSHCNTLQQHTTIRRNTLHCIATHCITLQSVLQRTVPHCKLHHTTVHCSSVLLQHTTMHCSCTHSFATHYDTLHLHPFISSTLQHTATHCDTLQHTALAPILLQHTTTHCNCTHFDQSHCNNCTHSSATHCKTLQLHIFTSNQHTLIGKHVYTHKIMYTPALRQYKRCTLRLLCIHSVLYRGGEDA